MNTRTIRLAITLLLLVISTRVFGQFNYSVYQALNDKDVKLRNSKIRYIEQFGSKDSIHWRVESIAEINPGGLPKRTVQYAWNNDSSITNFFLDSLGDLSHIEENRNDRHSESTEFEYNEDRQIASIAEYVFGSVDQEKIFVRQTMLIYNTNKSLYKQVELDGYKKDTTEVAYFDAAGRAIYTVRSMSGLRARRIQYEWNADRSVMTEKEYDTGSVPYTSIIHKYKYKKEIERVDPSLGEMKLYWIYDDLGRVVETNSSIYCIEYSNYDREGDPTSKKIHQIFTDDNTPMPQDYFIRYEYIRR